MVVVLAVVKKLISLVAILGLASCASFPSMTDSCSSKTAMGQIGACVEEPQVVIMPTFERLQKLPAPEQQPIVAVYKFTDQTGQRKQKDNVAMFSTAVTQGGAPMLIDALKTAGGGSWFRVVEREGLDNLVRERQIVRSTREQFQEEGESKETIQPLLFQIIIPMVLIHI